MTKLDTAALFSANKREIIYILSKTTPIKLCNTEPEYLDYLERFILDTGKGVIVCTGIGEYYAGFHEAFANNFIRYPAVFSQYVGALICSEKYNKNMLLLTDLIGHIFTLPDLTDFCELVTKNGVEKIKCHYTYPEFNLQFTAVSGEFCIFKLRPDFARFSEVIGLTLNG